MLLAQGARVPKGAKGCVLEDYEAGGSIDVPLDPSRPAKAQAEGFFAKARRLQRGAAVMQRRFDETVRAAAAIDDLGARIAGAPIEPSVLEALAKEARALGLPLAAPEGPAARAASRERLPYHVHRSADGAPILVGRGAADNDALTTQHARPQDLWLHAKGFVGAHVVVPLAKRAVCPSELLVDAATLAAHFSDARREAICDVTYVPRRYVRKPRGSAPGAVTFDRQKVIAVRIEPERLARLLASKEGA